MSEFGGGNIEGFWNDARIEILKTMSEEGRSDGAIADAIGAGCTRNMVHGKRDRMKLKVNAPRARVDLETRTPRTGVIPSIPKQKPPPPPIVSVEPETIGPIEDFATGCQWIHGNTNQKGWRMCGQPSGKARFCDYHHRKSLAPKGTKPVHEQQEAESLRQGVMARTGLG